MNMEYFRELDSQIGKRLKNFNPKFLVVTTVMTFEGLMVVLLYYFKNVAHVNVLYSKSIPIYINPIFLGFIGLAITLVYYFECRENEKNEK